MVALDVATQAELDAVSASAPVGSALVHTTGNETIAGVKTFTSQPVVPAASMVRLTNANAFGSSSTCIRRFGTVQATQGTDITYTDSATLGASFTVNVAGVYAITYVDQFASPGAYMGISLNTTGPSTNVTSLPAAEQLSTVWSNSNSWNISAVWVGYLAAGSVVRAHCANGAASGGLSGSSQFTICRLS